MDEGLRRTLISKGIENLVRWRWIAAALTVVIAIALGSGVTQLSFNADYRVFFPKDDPQITSLDNIHQKFSKSDTLLFVLKPKNGDVFTQDVMTAISDLTERAWKLPSSYRVDSLTNYQHIQTSGDVINIDDLLPNPAELTPEKLVELKKIATEAPELVGILLARDNGATGVLVTLQLPESDPMAVVAANNAARKLIEYFSAQYADIDIALTGLAAIGAAYPEATQKDMETLTPLMYLIILILATITLRSIGAMLIVLLVLTLSTVGALGIAGWLDVLLTPPSGLTPTIILVIAVADVVHIILASQRCRALTEGKKEAVIMGIKQTIGPITITSFTTAIGFLSLQFSASEPYRDLGLLAAIGAILAWAIALGIVPALAPLTALKLNSRLVGFSIFSKTVPFLLRNPKRTFLCLGIGFILSALPITLIEINDRIVENFDKSLTIRQDTDFTLDHLTGIYRLEVAVGSRSDSGVSDPQYLEFLDQFGVWLRSRSEVLHVNILTDSVKRLTQAMHEGAPEAYRLPKNPDLAAQILLLYEMSLPYGLSMTDRVDISGTSSRVVATLGALDTKELRTFKEVTDAWLSRNSPDAVTASPATGEAIVFAYLSHTNISHMMWGVGFALAVVSLVIIVALKNFKLGILSILPNVAPFVVMFGIWGIFRGEINTAAANVCVVAYGLVVDATIHILYDYNRRRSVALSPPDVAMAETISAIGPALFINSIILALGFCVLALSSFKMNADLGILAAITITIAFILDIIMLPPLIVFFDTARTKTSDSTSQKPLKVGS
ncbi:MAG: hypothetical protein COB46_04380 [Rhodospirillaceae bacterium]|nr:MAG: hypothetical protein COB46_04380 [Rhodospirillaceae bacterium]